MVLRELTFQVLYVEVFKFPLDLAEQVHQIAPQRQRELGVLRGSKGQVAVAALSHFLPEETRKKPQLKSARRASEFSNQLNIQANKTHVHLLFRDPPSQIIPSAPSTT